MKKIEESKVSVIIPSYNSEKYISETVNSVLEQTYINKEILLIDDGSTDSTVNILKSIGEKIRIFHQSNSGPSAARNLGVKEALGEFIAFIDSDDIWEKTKLEYQVNYLTQYQDVVAVGSSFTIFGEGISSKDIILSNKLFLGYTPLDFLASPKIHPSSIMIRTEVAKSVLFPNDIRDGEDVIYAAIVRSFGKIGCNERILMKRRIHHNQATKDDDHFKRGLQSRIDWLKENYQLLNIESVEQAVDFVFDCAVDDVLNYYWMRDIKNYKKKKADIISIWPKNKKYPKRIDKLFLPKFILKLKDFIVK